MYLPVYYLLSQIYICPATPLSHIDINIKNLKSFTTIILSSFALKNHIPTKPFGLGLWGTKAVGVGF
jgi:hypothetical protein